jgi:hypothetical protein
VHHLDLIDHYIFQFFQTFVRKCLKLYRKNITLIKKINARYIKLKNVIKSSDSITLKNKNYLFNFKKLKR